MWWPGNNHDFFLTKKILIRGTLKGTRDAGVQIRSIKFITFACCFMAGLLI